MNNARYEYSPIIHRRPLKWPQGARIAFWIPLNIEYFHIDKPLSSVSASPFPDVPGYSLRDYGLRVGVFRIMEILDKYGLRASVFLNADVCEHCPAIIEEGNKRRWEWLGHGITNNSRMTDYPSEQERNIIREVRERITAAVGTAPKGWAGPGLAETPSTPDHVAAEGFEYLCDWGCDDQPILMQVRGGRIIALPVHPSISDISIFLRSNQSPEQYLRQVCDHFDILYKESAQTGKVMELPLHTFVIGLPFRIKYLDKALEYICSHEGVWFTTGGKIASWYYRQQKEDRGILE
ncbi:MAG: polysaccharide deacetylase family protein [Deltaproteobacteria bacterium]|nr:polysaccharide deacetylase family protein [Deltaproteobacteria bacterium]